MRHLATAITALVLAASGVTALVESASAALTWTAPRRIPGTVGQVNPVSAVAPDGTAVVMWLVGTGVGTQNALHAKVRLPGTTRWRDVPVELKASYLQDVVIVPTSGGDFWIAYQRGNFGAQAALLAKLDSSARDWTRPRRVFLDPAYDHAGPRLARTGDGTLVVAAYARLLDPPPGDPIYRVEVAIWSPGDPWRRRFLSPADGFAAGPEVAANGAGDIVVSFVQGYDTGVRRVRAATRRHGSSSTWKLRTLSPAGDAQHARAAIGSDGTAAVVWTADATSQDAVRLATIDADRDLAPWIFRDVVTGSSFSVDPQAVVDPHGHVTVVWRHSSGGNATLMARHLAGPSLDSPVRLSPTDRLAEFVALKLRPDGRVALLYQLFGPGTVSQGLRFRTLDHGDPGVVVRLTGDAAADGDANGEGMGIDRRSRATVIYTRGTYPDTDFVWLGQVPD